MIVKGKLVLGYNEFLTSLGTLEEVYGDLYLRNCLSLKNLGKLKKFTGI